MPSERPSIPEAQLAAAVIRRAIDDALTPDERLAKCYITETASGQRESWTSGVTPQERTEAVRFLLDRRHRWGEARAAWCDAAGLDPTQLVRHVLRHIPLHLIPTDIRAARRLAEPGRAPTALREAA
jgi:hypothetical protein